MAKERQVETDDMTVGDVIKWLQSNFPPAQTVHVTLSPSGKDGCDVLTLGFYSDGPVKVAKKKKNEQNEARAAGYTGEMCQNPTCGSFKVRRNGTCLICDECGQTTGCS